MIDKLRSIAVFAAVVEKGTFRAAARHLGLAPSRVSEMVGALEKDLGVTLLYRSTRQLSLTHEGRTLNTEAQAMLAAAERGLDAIGPMSKDPSGVLRVTAPAFVAQTGLMDTFSAFLRQYPLVKLEFDFSEYQRDLIRDGFDVAIRAGWLQDSDLLARNIGEAPRMLVASPDYFSERPEPTHARDLEAWHWIRFAMRPDHTELRSPDGETVSVLGRSNVTVSSASALVEFATRGLGVTAIPGSMARRGIGRGDLVHVLPDWTLRPLGLHAVWPDQSRRENLTLLFIRFLARRHTTSAGE